MNINCTYILPNKYDALVKKAFDIVKKVILTSISDINENQELGYNQDSELMEINKFYFLINYMIIFRRSVENYIESKPDKCINEEDLNKFKEIYNIQCIIESGVCNQYTNNIVQLFLEFPKCESELTYNWLAFDSCVEIEGELTAVSTNLASFRNNVFIETLLIPINTTVSEFADILQKTELEVTELYNQRFSPATPDLCCNDPDLDFPIEIITDITENTLVFDLQGNAPSYNLEVTNLNTSIIESTSVITSFTNITILNLLPNTDYSVRVFTSNCKGDIENIFTFTTKPIIITVYADDTVIQEITLDVILGDEGNVVDYGSTFTINFEDLTAPFFTIGTVLKNNENFNSALLLTSPSQNQGVISFPFVTESFRVDLLSTVACQSTIEYYEVFE